MRIRIQRGAKRSLPLAEIINIRLVVILLLMVFLTGCGKIIEPEKVVIPRSNEGLIDVSDSAQVLTMDKIREMVVIEAKKVYEQAKADGIDFTNGPCLSNDFFPDWVVDIVHDPRQPVDNLPENQCSYFRERKAHHFVELDEQGNVIKIY